MTQNIFLEQLASVSNKVTEIHSLLALFVPKTLTVSELAKAVGKEKGTIRIHLENNFLKGVDYFQEVEKGKITIPRSTALSIAQYYAKKEQHHA